MQYFAIEKCKQAGANKSRAGNGIKGHGKREARRGKLNPCNPPTPSGKEHVEVLSCLVENEADLNEGARDNCTPLMIASLTDGHVNVVSFLVEHGANMDQTKTRLTQLCIMLCVVRRLRSIKIL